MASHKGNGDKKQEIVAVAIDKDKGSQAALKWAADNLLGKGKCVTLLHVKLRNSSSAPFGSHASFSDNEAKKLFLPFRFFCMRKDIQFTEVVIEDVDIAKAICEYVKKNMIETLVVGSSAKNGFARRLMTVDIPGSVNKMAPDFCTVYVISKGKVASCRSSSHSASFQG